MKKLIALILCLMVTTPCFAAGRYHQMPPRRIHHHQPLPPHYERRVEYYHDVHYHRGPSTVTKTFGVIAGVAGVAAIISAIAD